MCIILCNLLAGLFSNAEYPIVESPLGPSFFLESLENQAPCTLSPTSLFSGKSIPGDHSHLTSSRIWKGLHIILWMQASHCYRRLARCVIRFPIPLFRDTAVSIILKADLIKRACRSNRQDISRNPLHRKR